MFGIVMVFKWMDGTKPLNWPTTGAVILECQKIPIHTMILIPVNRLKRRMQLLLCPICRSLLFRSFSSPGSCIAFCARTQQAMIQFTGFEHGITGVAGCTTFEF